MAVTVSRPVVHDSGLGTLAQLLGVYVGYQNMKTRRSGELRALGQFPEARRTIGAPDPFKGKEAGSGKGTSLMDSLRGQQPAEEARAKAEGPGLSLFPTGRPDILKDTDVVAKPAVPATPPPEDRTIPEGFAGELLAKTPKQLERAEKSVTFQSKIFQKAGSVGKDWGDIQAERLFPSLKNMPKTEKGSVRNIVSAVSGKKNISPEVRVAAISKNMGKVSEPVKREMQNLAVSVAPTVENISEITGRKPGQTGWANKGTNALSVNYANAMLGAKGVADEIRITEQHAVVQETLNKELGNQSNIYERILSRKYGILGQRISRPRGGGRGPGLYKVDHGGQTHTYEAYSQSQALNIARGKLGDNSIALGQIKPAGRAGSEFEEKNLVDMNRRFRASVRKNPEQLPSEGYEIFEATRGKKLPYFDTKNKVWTTPNYSDYLKKLEREYDASFTGDLDDENEEAFKNMFGFNFEDYKVAKNRGDVRNFQSYLDQKGIDLFGRSAVAAPRRTTINPFIRRDK